MYYIQYCFFTSGGGADDMLVRLSLVEEIIKDANLMCISSTDIWGIMNKFVQYVQNYFQYLYIDRLTGSQVLEGVAGKERSDLFQGENALKSDLRYLMTKKVYKRKGFTPS